MRRLLLHNKFPDSVRYGYSMEKPDRLPADKSIERIAVTPWPSEMTLKVFIMVISISIWFGLILSIFGIIYVAFIGFFLFFTHLIFIAMVRGNAVQVSPAQYPELYARLELLCQRAGLKDIPETYIMQAGGDLNALATKFMRSKMIIIFSDLLDACEDDERAQDMIIGHEIGHIRQGHLNALWFLLPGLWVPFLGAAYSRACEYTCDRYGFALSGEPASALKGLAILSAGKKYGSRVNYTALVKQRDRLETGLMTLGVWLMSHPPICDRVAALDKTLAAEVPRAKRGRERAFLILFLFFAIICVGSAVGVALFIKGVNAAKKTAETVQQSSDNIFDSTFTDSLGSEYMEEVPEQSEDAEEE